MTQTYLPPIPTPWGQSQSRTEITRGVRWVTTAGHGGLMVSRGVAAQMLSAAAQARGEVYGGYLCYEEDCAWTVAMYERPEWERSTNAAHLAELDRIVASGRHWPYETPEHLARVRGEYAARAARSDEEVRADLFPTLARWEPKYLLSVTVSA